MEKRLLDSKEQSGGIIMSFFESKNLNKMLIPYILALVAGCMAIGSIFYSEIKTGKAYKEAAYANQKAHEYESETQKLHKIIEKRNARIYELEASSADKFDKLDKHHQDRQYKQTEIYLGKVQLLEKTIQEILEMRINVNSELNNAKLFKEKSEKIAMANEKSKQDLEEREKKLSENENNLKKFVDEAIVKAMEQKEKFFIAKKIQNQTALENYTTMYNLLNDYDKAKGAVDLALKQQKIKKYLPKYDDTNAKYFEFSKPYVDDNEIADMKKRINNQIGEIKKRGLKE
jgi:hypothetical protein